MARKHNKQVANKAKGPDKNRAPGKSPSKSGRKRASEEDSHSDSGSGKEEKRSSSSSDSRTKKRQKETDTLVSQLNPTNLRSNCQSENMEIFHDIFFPMSM